MFASKGYYVDGPLQETACVLYMAFKTAVPMIRYLIWKEFNKGQSAIEPTICVYFKLYRGNLTEELERVHVNLFFDGCSLV